MSSLFHILLIALSGYYALLMGYFALGFLRVRRGRDVFFSEAPALVGERPLVSVIVPARNEEDAIQACVESLMRSTYPAERREIIVVDDGSTDRTPEILQALQQRAETQVFELAGSVEADSPPALRIVTLTEPGGGAASRKRKALEAGLEQASGDLVLTTDADCLAQPEWIERMAAAFGPSTGFVAGPVLFPAHGTAWKQIQSLEFLGLVAVGAGSIGMGRPILCNGANTAYRRAAFEAVGGYAGAAEGAAGDDELLMWKIAASERWSVRFCAAPAAAVETDPAPDVRAFLRQRLRWGSLASQYPSVPVVAALAGVFVFYLLLLGGTAAAFFVPGVAPVVLASFLIKAVAELLVLVPACRHFGRTRLLVWLLPAQLFQVVYIIVCAALGTLRRYNWGDA